jgi:hypothetical protein
LIEREEKLANQQINKSTNKFGGLAQLARALALQARGQGFESLILHQFDYFTFFKY